MYVASPLVSPCVLPTGWLVCAEGEMSTAWWPRGLLFESVIVSSVK